MAPRSPTHAFDPSPALEHDATNFSPLNQPAQEPQSSFPFSGRPNLPPHGRHSIATTTVPLLSAVSSASQIPKQAFQITNPPAGIDINAYIEHCRSLNEQLRQAQETERRTWDIERSALKSKIADLEFRLNKATNNKRRSSNDSVVGGVHFVNSEFPSSRNILSEIQTASPVPCSAPVWRGPESTPPATRVFANEDDIPHLPSISEDAPLSDLTKEISPTSNLMERVESHPIPIEQVDRSLEGVMLKSTGLESSFNHVKVASPKASPTTSPPTVPETVMVNGMAVELDRLISPLSEQLKRNAGHTPMFDRNLSVSTTGSVNTQSITPQQEGPIAPAPSTRLPVRPPLRPSENSDSYFSFASEAKADSRPDAIKEEAEQEAQLEATDDPVLKGPLMLDPKAKTEAANAFLEKVDAKLMEAALRSRKDSVLSDPSDASSLNGENQKPRPPQTNGHHPTTNVAPLPETFEPRKQPDDDMPALKLKQSSNFGSAWGGDRPGKV